MTFTLNLCIGFLLGQFMGFAKNLTYTPPMYGYISILINYKSIRDSINGDKEGSSTQD